ncbi:MAG: hypothetical protein DWQ10_07165 [Calditrichaeota bacterium]|nr:MAG: hypothetical protein DWQ10_07165 [Calditrichota bacterium]
MRVFQSAGFVLLLFFGVCYSQEFGLPIRGTNTKYEQGDWITYAQNRFVTSIALGNQFVYFGTTGGITRYNHWENVWDFPFTVSSGLADNNVKAVAFDENTSLLWAATETAISVYTPSSERWENYFFDAPGINGFGQVVKIGFDSRSAYFRMSGGALLTCSNTGGPLFVSDGHYDGAVKFVDTSPPHQNFPHFFMDVGFTLLQDGTIQDNRLHEAKITALLSDKWYKTWMGSWGFGALVGDINSQQLSFLRHSLFAKDVGAIALDENGLWIAGKNRNTSSLQDQGLAGITYWDQVNQKWLYYESDYIPNLITDEINRITTDGPDVFFATRFGLSIYNRPKNQWTKLTTFDGLNHENIFDVGVWKDIAYIGSEGGLNAVDLHTLRTDTLDLWVVGGDDLKLSRVLDIEINGDLLWAATDYGVYVYNLADDTGGFVDDVNGPVGARITAVTSFGSEVWIGTDRGVFPYDVEKQEWPGLPEKNFSINSPIYEMAADAHSVWVVTDRGVFKLNRANRYWVHYTMQDGLASNQVHAVLLDGDYVWFGTPKGLTLFYWNDPNRID